MDIEGVPQKSNTEGEETVEPINWEALREDVVAKIRACMEAQGSNLSEEQIQDTADGYANLKRYFPIDKYGNWYDVAG